MSQSVISTAMIERGGYFYSGLMRRRGDDGTLKNCIEKTLEKLLISDTSLRKPGILLGEIQSGKTRAFLGVIALAFDNGYDMAVVLTKGTKALTEQTLKRLHEDFSEFEDDSKVQIHDIMLFPKNMVPYELSQKLVIVAKKETHNLQRVLKTLTERYPDLKDKKVLIIDDEADFASISFRKEKETGTIESGTIATQIDNIRMSVDKSEFLQVTATPYSIYLQPSEEDGVDLIFPPKRPAFTVLLPIHGDYIGGKYYFIDSQDESSPAAHVYKEVPPTELDALRAKKTLKRADRRSFKLEDAFTSPSIATLRSSILNFIVGACIRRLQQNATDEKSANYSFIIHTEASRTSHSWQESVVRQLNENLTENAKDGTTLFKDLVKTAYEDMKPSVELAGLTVPTFEAVLDNVSGALSQGMLVIETVNSDKEVRALLDNKGQLKLRTPLNIFIGGQILDRGITIKNLIGFYYGRNPNKFQQDTVLQHSRMYGARSPGDLAVTRFYTTRSIYEVMRRIHEFDNALREAFLSGSHDNGVYFIRKDASDHLVPCSPNKIMLSSITTLKPFKRLLPIGFQTHYKTKIKKAIADLDDRIAALQATTSDDPFLIGVDDALDLIHRISETFVFENEGYDWDLKSHKASLEHLSGSSKNAAQRGKVWLLVRSNRRNARIRQNRFFDAPDTSHVEGKIARSTAIDLPMLMLFRQDGDEAQGWRDSPFWWPVIVAPKNTRVAIYAGETNKTSP